MFLGDYISYDYKTFKTDVPGSVSQEMAGITGTWVLTTTETGISALTINAEVNWDISWISDANKSNAYYGGLMWMLGTGIPIDDGTVDLDGEPLYSYDFETVSVTF